MINGSGLDKLQLLRVVERHANELNRSLSRLREGRKRIAFTSGAAMTLSIFRPLARARRMEQLTVTR